MAFPPSWRKYLVRDGSKIVLTESQITLRVPSSLKGRAMRCSRIRNMKLTPWLIEAIEDKCEMEESEMENQ